MDRFVGISIDLIRAVAQENTKADFKGITRTYLPIDGTAVA